MIRRLLNLVAAWRTISEPLKFRSMDSSVCSMMFLTPRAAAIWKTMSDCSTNFSTSALSRISPSWTSIFPCRCAMFLADPVLMLSRIVTSSPRAIQASAR